MDDYAIYSSGPCLQTLEKHLQDYLNTLSKWTDSTGFKISKEKTVLIHFNNSNNSFLRPNLQLRGTKIPPVDNARFLCITLNSKLSYLQHINALKTKCKKTLNLLKTLSNTDWGANRPTLLTLCRSLIRSKIDFGCFIYSAARKHYLKQIETMENEALRISLGVYRTTPITSLHVEASELPFHLRCTNVGLSFAIRILSDPHNPSYYQIRIPTFKNLFNLNKRILPPLGIRLQPHLTKAKIKVTDITKTTPSPTPIWELPTPSAFLNLTAFTKSHYHPSFFYNKYCQLTRHFKDYSFIFTDGSTQNDISAAAAVCPGLNLSSRLPDGASIFSAEAKAILLALNYIELSFRSRYVIFSDSNSVLLAITNMKWTNPFILQILLKYNALKTSGKRIILFWIPSHVNIPGNDRADAAAKKALKNPVTNLTIPYSDFRSKVSRYLVDCWQSSWSMETSNKLHSINPKVNTRVPIHSSSRREDVVITRLRLGHTHLTHSFLLSNSLNPPCPFCGIDTSIHHILITCPLYDNNRSSLSSPNSISSLFRENSSQTIIKFIRNSGLFLKL